MKKALLATAIVLVGLMICLALDQWTSPGVTPEAQAQAEAPALTGEMFKCKVKFNVGACTGNEEFSFCSPNWLIAQVSAMSAVCRRAGSCEDVCWDHGDASCTQLVPTETCYIPD